MVVLGLVKLLDMLAAERGLQKADDEEGRPSKEATPDAASPALAATESVEEPNQLPTPLSTDEEHGPQEPQDRPQASATDKYERQDESDEPER